MKKELLNDGIVAYQALRRSSGLSRGATNNEAQVLRRLLETVGNIYISNITEVHVTRYFEKAAQTRSPASLRIDHVYLRSFFEWARRTGRMSLINDPMAGRRPPKPMKVERRRIHVSKFPHLLDVAGARNPRNRAVVAVGLYTLLRDQEMARLTVGDVDLDAGYVKATITKSFLEDRMPICVELDQELRQWFTAYAAQCGPLRPEWFLFPRQGMPDGIRQRNAKGQVMTGNFYYDPTRRLKVTTAEVRHALRGIGWGEGEAMRNEGSHTLRRSGARALYDALVEDGHDYAVRVVMTMLHHSSMTTTEHYIGVTPDRRSRDTLIRGHVMFKGVAEAAKLRAVAQ